MALGDGLGNANKNAQDLNKNLSATEQSLNNATQSAAGLTDQTRSLTEELKDQLNIRSRTSETEKALLGVSRDITKSAQENKVALGQQGTISKQLVKEQNQLLAAQREQLIAQNGLSTEQIAQAQQIADKNQTRLDTLSKIDELQSRLVNTTESERSGIQSSIRGYQDRLAANEASLDAALENADVETQRLALSNQLVAKAQENIKASKEEEATQNKINESMGITGGILKGLNQIGGEFTKALNLDKVQQDMQKFAEESIRAGKEVSKLQVLGKGISSAFGNLKQKITDPAVIFSTLADAAFSTSQDVANLQRSTGMSYGNASALNAEFRMVAQSSGQIQISAKKLHEAYAAVTTELGVAGDILGNEALISVSNLTKKLGMSSKEATQLALMSRLQGENTEEILSNTIASVGEFNKQNKTAINYKAVLKDVANSSKRLQVSLGANPQALTEAATAAASLGLSLKDVEQIADSLLNFESSIQKELEAELLTGKQYNLEKAREYALNNDIKGLSEEIANNQDITAAFASGNRIEQKAIAEMMGLSVEQLGNMFYQQELNKLSAEQFKEKYGEAAYEQAKTSSAAEKFGYTMDRVKEIIGNIGMLLAPVLDFVAAIVSKWYVLYPLLGVVALSYVPKLTKGFSDFASSVKEGAKGVKDIAKGLAQAVTGKGTSKLKDAVTGGTGKAAEATGKAAKAGSAAKPGMGKQIQGLLTGLGNGLKQMAGTKVLQGALNLIPAALGFTAMTAGAIGLAAVALAGNAAGVGLQGLGTGLTVFAQAMSVSTPFGPVGLVAPVALALLGASMIPLAYALSLLAPPLEAIGSIISAVFTGIGVIITSVAEGFTMFLGAITFEKAAALPLVGLGLVALAAGVTAMALVTPFLPLAALGIWGLSWALEPLAESMAALGPNLQMISTGLVSLTGIAPTLFTVAGGLAAISAGLASMAFAGFAALPIIGALTALGTVSEGLGSIFGGGDGGSESKDDGSLKKVEEKLDQLISIVSAGGDVFIDGSKVGKTLQLASSKMG